MLKHIKQIKQKQSKIVVFDMDETLGYFIEFSIFWESLNAYIKDQNIDYLLSQKDFNNILDLYPEFIRPNFTSVLNYIKHKKQSKSCDKVMIYTNNQGPKQWIYYIKEYFEQKIKYKLFDNIISAFKVNGKHLELCRTTHDKTLKDFINCSKVSIENAQICFLDDIYYPNMNYDNVYYIKVKPYVYNLSFDEIINRFVSSEISKKILASDVSFFTDIKKYIEQYGFVCVKKNTREYDMDKLITKKIMIHLQNFFSVNNFNSNMKYKNNKSKKYRLIKNKTVKLR